MSCRLFGEELRFRVPISSLSVMSVCNISYLSLWFRGRDVGSDFIRSWSLLIFKFSVTVTRVCIHVLGQATTERFY